MDYARFVALRQPACERFAHGLAATHSAATMLTYEELEQLSIAYRQLLHDYALARARFPGTAFTRRLEQLVLDGTHQLQRDVADHRLRPIHFVTHSFPRAFRHTLPLIGLTTALFMVAALLGLCLAAIEPAFGVTFLPLEAIEGLKKGKLWTESIFAVMPASMASSAIATNNLSVAMTGWAGGAVAGLGAFYVVLMNGLMLGTVLAVTWSYGMAPSLLTFIAAHGPLEISLILITAAAGLDIGRALVIAADQPRGVRLREASRRALVVLVGCMPWFVVLGIVETFVSPLATVPVASKVALGLLLEVLFLVVALNPFLPLVRQQRPEQEPAPEAS